MMMFLNPSFQSYDTSNVGFSQTLETPNDAPYAVSSSMSQSPEGVVESSGVVIESIQ
jgi:hypothetical protein